MTIKVRYLSEDEIEQDAELLLAEYRATIDAPIELPVPIAEIATYSAQTKKKAITIRLG